MVPSPPQRVFIGDGTTSLEVDVTIKEKHKAAVDVTDHAVEQGIAVSDHARPKPEEIQIDGMVSNSPAIVGAVVAPNYPADTARQFMHDLHDHPRLVSVITVAWTYTDMILTEISEDRDAKTGDVFEFSATFKHVRQVTNQTTMVATKQPKAKPQANQKQKPTSAAPTQVGAKLFKVTQGIGAGGFAR
jgi:hypothetical protein